MPSSCGSQRVQWAWSVTICLGVDGCVTHRGTCVPSDEANRLGYELAFFLESTQIMLSTGFQAMVTINRLAMMLTHCGLVMPTSERYLCQHWLNHCWLTAPSHYLYQFWLIGEVLWHFKGNLTGNTSTALMPLVSLLQITTLDMIK